MATEIRYIVFTQEEVRHAICRALARQNPALPADAVSSISLSGKGGSPSASVTFKDKGQTARREFDTGELLSTAVLFCRDHRIPLSVRAAKRIEYSKGRLALVSSLNVEPTGPRIVDGGVRYDNVPSLDRLQTAADD